MLTFFQIIFFKKIILGSVPNIRVSNNFEPDQGQHSVGPELGSKTVCKVYQQRPYLSFCIFFFLKGHKS